MDVFTSAAEFLRHRRPERPVLALRPHAARRAASWFLANFPGRVLYAAKANDAAPIIDALTEAGIRAFDVASMVEIERLAGIRDAELFFMNPVKSRDAILRAYRVEVLAATEALPDHIATTGRHPVGRVLRRRLG